MCLSLLLLATISQPVTIDVHPDEWAGWVPEWLLSSGDEIVQFMSTPGLDGLVVQTGVPMLRWGGLAADYYDWEGFDYEGAWYIDWYYGQVIALPTPGSIDDLLQFCEQTGIEPVLTVNHQLNDPGKARRLVEYCNGDTSTPMGALRAQRGHPEPYDVTYWCVGNEPDIAGSTYPTPYGTWTFYRHFGIPFEDWQATDSVYCTAPQFGELAGEYIDSMRAASPIPLQIGGLSLAGDVSWIAPVISPNADEIDWMDAHYYPVWTWESDSSMYHDLLWAPDSSTIPLEPRYELLRGLLDEAGGQDIPLWILEYNVAVMAEDQVWWNYLDGLLIADCIGHLAHAGAPAASVYSIAEGGADDFPFFSVIRTDTLSARAGAHVLQMYHDLFGGTLVETDCSAAMEQGLEAWSSLTGAGRVAVMVVNRDLYEPVPAHLALHGWVSGGSFEVWQMTNDAPLSAPWNGTTGIVHAGIHDCGPYGLDWVFPEASVTCIQILPTTGIEDQQAAGSGFTASPNPSGGPVTFSFTSATSCEASVTVFDVAGRVVAELSGTVEPGEAELTWTGGLADGSPAPAGSYLALLRMPDLRATTGVRLKKLKLSCQGGCVHAFSPVCDLGLRTRGQYAMEGRRSP